MQIVNVDIQYLSPPPAIKYCKKCGKKTEYVCSGLFRVNAQRKYLDIWLIYKCSNCDSTWNMTIYSRINPKSIASEILEGFHSNNGELVEKYAMDTELIQNVNVNQNVDHSAHQKIDHHGKNQSTRRVGNFFMITIFECSV
ncbi:DUF1062 domain-containing protein [Brevibacillus borstelensis]|uniref:DUF1062 domain-containing protein n=1 Tax=Brevibacillus borstelensis TaxID=45462 RepID=UPI0030F7A549